MAEQFQFNRISMQHLARQLKARQTALPTLKSKESVLRMAIQRQKEEVASLKASLDAKQAELMTDVRLWAEFPYGIFSLKRIETEVRKVAGVPVPHLKEIVWDTREFSKFNKAVWIATGVRLLKDVATLTTMHEIAAKTLEILEKARRKTTQKVNLYEKIQIPRYSSAITRIKRYLEDVENLEKSAQKLTRQRKDQEEAVS